MSIQEYYGKILKTNRDLKTDACCPAEALPPHIREVAAKVHPEVLKKFYGCGSPLPAVLKGKTVLDLGCGTGRDVFILSKLVGPEGRAIGVDMTDEQLAVAKKHAEYHRQTFGYARSNTEFLRGMIEDLEGLGLKNESADVVVSNCVINLSPDKRRVFSEIFRVLKPGGELYFADIFAGRRVPEAFAQDPIAAGECLGGALYTEDFRRLLAKTGCRDYRVVTRRPLTLKHPGLAGKAGRTPFYSMTVRAFKLDLEDRCEDYGQTVRYLGTIPEYPRTFSLDDHHLFEKGKRVPVCGNTAAMLSRTRYAAHFLVEGDASTHYGLFDCGSGTSSAKETDNPQGCC